MKNKFVFIVLIINLIITLSVTVMYNLSVNKYIQVTENKGIK